MSKPVAAVGPQQRCEPLALRRWLTRLAAGLALGAALAGCSTTGSLPGGRDAIGSEPVPAPKIAVGDRWVYQGLDGESGNPVALERVVTRISGDVVQMRQRGLDRRGQPESGERMRSMSRTTLALDVPNKVSGQMRYADFPLALGKSWQYGYQLSGRTDSVTTYRVGARVDALERVRVPAGVFDALRVEHQGDWDTPVLVNGVVSSLSGKISATFWYAPAVNGWARIDLTLYRPDGSVQTRLQQELVSYHPAQR